MPLLKAFQSFLPCMMSVLGKLTYKKILRFIPKEMGQSLGKTLVNILGTRGKNCSSKITVPS